MSEENNLPTIFKDISASTEKLEDLMLSLPQVDCNLVHSFGPGTYIRQITIPAGTVAIGHYQNFDHVNIFVKGKVLMVNDDGSQSVLTAPMTFVGKPGRKIGYIIEDMTWINVYPTEETDIEKLEAKYVTKSDVFLEHESKKIETLKIKQIEQGEIICQ